MMSARVLVLALACLTAGCAARLEFPEASCRGDEKAMHAVELFFGRDIAGQREVSEAEWDDFVERELGPRFPDGLTVTDAAGRYYDPVRRVLTRERTKHVLLVVAPDPSTTARIGEITEAYRSRFQQQSVGLVRRAVCSAF